MAKNGSDSNHGSETHPWRTIQKAADTIVAGDTVYVKAGIYYESIQPANSGTSPDSMITFKAYPGDTVIIDGEKIRLSGFDLAYRDYIRIEGFEIRNTLGTPGLTEAGIRAIGVSMGNEILNNKLHDNGISESEGALGIYADYSTSWLIQNNEVYENKKHGIQLVHDTNSVISNNYVHHNTKDGIEISGGSFGTIVEYNFIKDHPDRHDDGIYAFSTFGNITIRYNTIVNSSQSIYFSQETHPGNHQTKSQVYGNILYQTFNHDKNVNGIVIDGVDHIDISNNTIFEVEYFGIRVIGGATDVVVRNNIFYKMNRSDAICVQMASTSGNALDYNLYFTAKNDIISWDGTRYSLEEFQAEGLGEEHGISKQDPLFVDLSNYDFHLQSDSPAIDAGIDVGLPYLGSAPDMGAFEFSGPLISGIPDTSFWEDETLSIHLDDYVEDPTNSDSELRWTIRGNDSIIATIDEISHIISFSAPINWYGQEVMTFTVTDPDSQSDSDTSTVTVIPVNDAPAIGDIPDTLFYEDSSLSFDLDEYVSDPDHADAELSWAYAILASQSNPEGFFVIIDSITHVVTFSTLADWNGWVEVELVATDPNLAADKDTMRVTVVAINDPPEILVSFPESTMIAISEGDTLSFWVSAIDVDSDSLTYLWTVNGFIQDVSDSIFVFGTDYTSAGIDTIGVKVSDGLSDTTRQWVLAINNLDRPPKMYSLSQNYPNPFNSETIIRYQLPKASHVILTIYNLLGQEVITLIDEQKLTGFYSVQWNGRSATGKKVGSGIYFYTIEAGEYRNIKKMVLLQ